MKSNYITIKHHNAILNKLKIFKKSNEYLRNQLSFYKTNIQVTYNYVILPLVFIVIALLFCVIWSNNNYRNINNKYNTLVAEIVDRELGYPDTNNNVDWVDWYQ
jgi:ABC-type multidrug transport system permease subunit